MKTYGNYKDYPLEQWVWPNFTPHEMRSKGDDSLAVNAVAMGRLQRLRNILELPMVITSAYRSPEHNRNVGGAAKSMHLQARAFDVQMQGLDPATFEAAARKVGFTGFGFYEESGFIHIDTGPAREWGNRWWKKPRTNPTQSTTIRAVAVTATSGASGAAVAVAKLDPTAQYIVLAFCGVAALSLLWIVRRRLARWAGGDR